MAEQLGLPPILVLDVDGVIIEGFPRQRWDRHLKADLGVNPKKLQRRFFKPHWPDVVSGRTPVEEPLAAFLAEHAPHLTVERFLEYWHGRDARVVQEVIDAARRWQQDSNGSLALATNQDAARAAYLKDNIEAASIHGWEAYHVNETIGAVEIIERLE